ncbi:hypothetical protein ACFE04_010062 [Oxalis oulophora]
MSNESSEKSISKSSGGFSSSSNRRVSNQTSDQHNKPFSGISNWLNSVSNRKNPSPASARMEQVSETTTTTTTSSALDNVLDAVARPDSDVEEEYQIQLALEMSAKEDPEAFQIEAVKQISLGSCDPQNTPAEIIAYRYWLSLPIEHGRQFRSVHGTSTGLHCPNTWKIMIRVSKKNYNSLSYDDKILDGFYDLYGILNDSNSDKMPSLVDLQGAPMSNNVSWEAILVNRAADANLLRLEEKALEMAVKSRSESLGNWDKDLVEKLSVQVSNFMGGPVTDPDDILRAWQSLSNRLKATLGSMVLPLGSLTVLADSVGLPCRLVKGQRYTGSDDAAMNFVKIDDGREYIVDLMAAPGTLIPADSAGPHVEFDDSLFSASPSSRDVDSSHVPSSSSGIGSSFEEHSEFSSFDKKSKSRNIPASDNQSDEKSDCNSTNPTSTTKGEVESKSSCGDSKYPFNVGKLPVREFPNKPSHPHMHARSPSWTEGVSSPAAQRMKVKDVSQYMIDAAKENPNLAQKLHEVLLESGVVAPPNLFTEIYPEKHLEVSTIDATLPTENKEEAKQKNKTQLSKNQDELGEIRYLPPLPHHKVHTESNPVNYAKNVPVAAAAAAAAAVVASSMVVAAKKSNNESNLELPMAAATAAAVVATTAVVNKQQGSRSDGDADGSGSGELEPENSERTSDKSASSSKSDPALDEVADCEILWEDITVGERIGLGSYGEVYRGDWHGTEVAVKRFLRQDITGESLEEFKSEVRIMKRIRHPNVVLFMGAVTRAPNLSIVTEFLPRGSLYRLLHRPNNQLDERRRLRMALDAARGMNYLHNCTPVIVHRDLKSPNLLVDKNWVVKVCDFGLSRMKHSTFLSSRSTAGTAEWMAPEVLRNEPSDEKCDVYSFGVILWELSTLQQPWNGMNPMQVVGAVGFQHRRLDIPDSLDPTVADIIRQCWQTDPKLRPTFAQIMAALKPLQKPITNSSVHRPNKGQPSQPTEDTRN